MEEVHSEEVERKLCMSLDDIINESKKKPEPKPKSRKDILLSKSLDEEIRFQEKSRGAKQFVSRNNPHGPRRERHELSTAYNAEGDYIASIANTVVVRIDQRGIAYLDSGGWRTPTTRNAINQVLKTYGIHVKVEDEEKKEWSVTDGQHFSKRFTDGMTINLRRFTQSSPTPLNPMASLGVASLLPALLQYPVVPNAQKQRRYRPY